MGKRGRPRKTNQVKTTIIHTEEELEGSPAEKVVATLKRLGFGPGDMDLGKEVIEAIEAMVGSPIESLRKDSPEKVTPRREMANPPTVAEATKGARESETQLGENVRGEVLREGIVKGQGKEQGRTLFEKGDSREGSMAEAHGSDREKGEKEGRKAWNEVVKGPQSLHPDQKLRYIPPSTEGVVITEEDCREGLEFWKHTMVGYAIGQKPGFRAIQRYVESLWKNAIPHVYQLSPGVFLFRFKSENEMETIMSSRWTFNRAPLIFQRWQPGMRLENLRPEKVAVWVRLSGLELHQWSNIVLSKIASFLGKPLQSDLLTAVRDRISFARVLVEIDKNSKLLDTIPLITIAGTSHISVIYEWYPAECPNCLKWGHKEMVCPGRKSGEVNNRQEKQQKATEVEQQHTTSQPINQTKQAYASIVAGKVWQAKTVTTTSEVPQDANGRRDKEVEEGKGGADKTASEEDQRNEPGQTIYEEVETEETEAGDLVGEGHYEDPDPPPLK